MPGSIKKYICFAYYLYNRQISVYYSRTLTSILPPATHGRATVGQFWYYCSLNSYLMPPYSTQVSRGKTKTYSKSTSSLAAAATQGELKRPAQTCLGDISATRGFVFERPNDLVLQIGQFGEANNTDKKSIMQNFGIIGTQYP